MELFENLNTFSCIIRRSIVSQRSEFRYHCMLPLCKSELLNTAMVLRAIGNYDSITFNSIGK